MTSLVLAVALLAPLDIAPAPKEEAPVEEPKVDPLKEAYKLVEFKKNSVANLEQAIKLYEENLPKTSDKKALIRGWTDVARAYLRIGDLKKKKPAKLKAFEAGKAAGEKAVKITGVSKRLRADALAWQTFNLAKVGETNGVMNSLFMVGELKKNLNQALKLDASNSYARATLATIFHSLPGLVGGSDKKAIELYEDSVKRSPGFGSGMCDLANLYVDINKKDKAREWFNKVLAIEKPEFKSDHWKFDKPCAKRGLKKLGK